MNEALKKMILDVGCGTRKREGAIGIDVNPKTSADVIHDLNKFPYPFGDSIFDEIYADNVIEHLDNIIGVMEELYRIAKPNAVIRIDVPYFRAHWAYIDPTHKQFFTTQSFSYFDPEHIYNKLFPYSTAKLQVEKTIFNERIVYRGIIGFVRNLIKYCANKHVIFYETLLSHLMPLDELTFYLRVRK